jgi:hypothetical protein
LRSPRRYDRARRQKIVLHRKLADLRLQVLHARAFGAAFLAGESVVAAGAKQANIPRSAGLSPTTLKWTLM